MSMEDILRVLVDSRQPASQTPAQADPMSELIGGLLGGAGTQGSGNQSADAVTNLLGGLLGGAQPQSGGNQANPMAEILGGLLGGQPQAGGNQQTGLGTVMSLLEMVTGSGQQGLGQTSLMGNNNPIMGLLQPYVAPLAKKLNISPEIAMMVIAFAVQKLLAHHPTSGRDSNQFNLDELLGQVKSGAINPDLLHNSGLVDELSKVTGLDKATATQSLDLAFNLVTKKVLSGSSTSANVSAASAGMTTPAPGRTLKSATSSAPKKISR